MFNSIRPLCLDQFQDPGNPQKRELMKPKMDQPFNIVTFHGFKADYLLLTGSMCSMADH